MSLVLPTRINHPLTPNSEMKKCPHCERMIPDDARICGFCGEKFSDIDVNQVNNIESPVAVVPPVEPKMTQVTEEPQVATVVNEPQPTPVAEEPQATRPVYYESAEPAKSHKGLWIGLISALVALLVGGGVTWLITNGKLNLGNKSDVSSIVPEADDEFEKEDQTDFTRHEREDYSDYRDSEALVEEVEASPVEDDEPVGLDESIGKVRVTGVNVRLRSTPAINDYNILKDGKGKNLHPYKGQVLTCIDVEGDFYYVYFNDMPCYISKQFAQFIE